ncbi:MAG: hypothetical protein M3N68_08470 [Actinomycetota bacterium]|nr:hypothetical protein [Actinomycetota bacterium]
MNEKANLATARPPRRATGRRWWCALGVAVTMLLVACGGGDSSDDKDRATTTAPTTTTTTIPPPAEDKARAERIVLTAADVPGFKADPPDAEEEEAAGDSAYEAFARCVNNNPLATAGDDDPREAESPDFSKGETETVSSSATFAEKEEIASALLTDLTAPAFAGCFDSALAKIFEAELGAAAAAVKVSTTPLPAQALGDQSVAYRSVVTVPTGRSSRTTFNIDSTFIRKGRAVGVLVVMRQGSPFRDSERMRLASLMATRMASA